MAEKRTSPEPAGAAAASATQSLHGGTLKRTLGPFSLWALGVGYVISGEYFGWNLGLPLAGSLGMLIAIFLVTLMYAGFVFSYAELACAMPRAGGAFVYALRAFGPFGGFMAGLAQLIEFVFAPPAIAMAIGAYLGHRYAWLDPRVGAAAAYLVFTGLNAWGVRTAATFELIVTVLAVGELLLFAGLTLPHFDAQAFMLDALPHGAFGVLEALPFAMWFYLAIEGVANAAEEAKDPQRDVVFGFVAALATLIVLTLLVYFAAVGTFGWSAVVYSPGSSEPSDAPLPLALARVVGTDSVLYAILLSVGLFGLVASFHGILLAAGRATLELGRAGFLPPALGNVHARSGTPRVALFVNMSVGLIAIATGSTADMITLSCFGALLLYTLSLCALFKLRRSAPELARPYLTPLYPWSSLLALTISLLCLICLLASQPQVGLWFLGLLAIGGGHYAWNIRRNLPGNSR